MPDGRARTLPNRGPKYGTVLLRAATVANATTITPALTPDVGDFIVGATGANTTQVWGNDQGAKWGSNVIPIDCMAQVGASFAVTMSDVLRPGQVPGAIGGMGLGGVYRGTGYALFRRGPGFRGVCIARAPSGHPGNTAAYTATMPSVFREPRLPGGLLIAGVVVGRYNRYLTGVNAPWRSVVVAGVQTGLIYIILPMDYVYTPPAPAMTATGSGPWSVSMALYA